MRSCAFDHIPSRTTWRFSLSRPYLPGALTSKLSGLLLRIHSYFSAKMGFEPMSPGLFMRLAKGPTQRPSNLTIPYALMFWQWESALYPHFPPQRARSPAAYIPQGWESTSSFAASLLIAATTSLSFAAERMAIHHNIALYRLFQDAGRDLHVRCLGIFIAPFILGGKPLRYVFLSPARPP